MRLMAGKYVLVTASTQGIGLAIVKLALQEGAAHVVINGRNEEKIKRLIESEFSPEEKERVSYVVADLSDLQSIDTLLESAIHQTSGYLNVVINSAGVSTRGTIETTTPDVWNEIFDLNARAALFISKKAIAHFLSRKINASITHNVSINAVCGECALLPYSMSKAALENLCKNLGHDMAMRSAEAIAAEMKEKPGMLPGDSSYPWIRVNGVLTGWVFTPGEIGYKKKEDPNAPDDWHLNPPLAAVPRGRMTKPEEIASTFLFLASDFSSHINGQTWIAEQFCLSGSPPRNLS